MKKILVICLLLALGQSYVLAQGYKLVVRQNGTNHRNNYMNDDYDVWGNVPNGRKICHITTRNNL